MATIKRNLNEILVAARMSKEPAILLEGKDDVSVYKNISKNISDSFRFYQINEIEDSSGCDSVIAAITRLQSKFIERTDNEKFILGIIDRDAREYKNTLPDNLIGVYVLKYYSIETYFVTRKNIGRLINKITFSTENNINETIIDFVEQNYHDNISNLYYISLESLKKECVIGYNSKFGYGDDETGSKVSEKKSREHILSQISISDLDEFANSLNISFQNIKQIAKGKWILYFYLYCAYHNIKKLKSKCNDNLIMQCNSCEVGNKEDCLFKLRRNKYQIENLYDDMLNFIDLEECNDLILRFKQLNYRN